MKSTLLSTTLIALSLSVLGACHERAATDAGAHTTAALAAGRFEGTLPCADCAGIKTTLTLTHDGSYTLVEQYEGTAQSSTPEAMKGKWSLDGQNIRLASEHAASEARARFEVLSPDRIRMLDQEGKHIDSTLPYELQRVAQP